MAPSFPSFDPIGASEIPAPPRASVEVSAALRGARSVDTPLRDESELETPLRTAREALGSGANPVPGPPNIVLINFDDASRSQFSWYSDSNRWPAGDNHPYAKMPWINAKLASHGIRFTRARVAARCAPTRACNLSGRQPHVSDAHPHGQKVGDIPQQGGLTEDYPTAVGVTADMNPWPKIASEVSNYHLIHAGKVHCTRWTLQDVGGALEDDPEGWAQICAEIGFHKAFKTKLGPQSKFEEPNRGYVGFDARTIESDGSQTTHDPGTDYITDWELNNIKTELTSVWASDPNKPFVLHWWTNSPHQVMPAKDITTTVGWGSRTATFSYMEQIPGVFGASGEVDFQVVADNFDEDWATYGPGYDADGVASSPFNPMDAAYPFGPEGSANVVFRRHVAQLESWDAYLEHFDLWLQLNNPDAWARTIYIIHCDNGEQDVAVQPRNDDKFEATLGANYAVLPPTVDGTTDDSPSNVYHDPAQAKDTVYDEGIMTPLIVFGEPIPVERRGADVDTLIDATDWHPTILDMIYPSWREALSDEDLAKIDGVSFAPGLNGSTYEGREYSVHQTYQPASATEGSLTRIQRCVIDQDGWKLMRQLDPDNAIDDWFMFDTVNDPGETTNQYANPTYSSRRAVLEKTYQSLIGNLD